MDPQAALDSAERLIEGGDLEAAEEYLAHYREWRRSKRGFEPEGGDLRCAQLEMQATAKARELQS